MTAAGPCAEPKAILVTGGTRGIGRGYVERMLLRGHHVFVVARSIPAGSLPEPGWGRLQALEADLTQPDGAARVVDGCLKEFGRIDVLVNNAGGSAARPPEALPGSSDAWAYFDDCLALNLLSQVMMCDAASPHMQRAGSGCILNVSSSGGRSHARVADAVYCAAKAGVLGLTRQLAYQLGPRGIRVNAIAPGTTLASPRVSERIEQLPSAQRERILAEIPLRRFAGTQDMVGPMEFLTVGASDYINGVVLDVNGGFYMA